ncbi:uncharacterized protein KD926_004680 [Aspergillus affinis]|uniref:uncharacterized protein n=1 Tax=Aspergillus affinis TaxID=1070780 RepID=UPI0022FE1C0C|nr:uncharacterized protein KD926_004680 [Aspergillus affinis]KAI9035055.1 hypothetical protein KD926_004680 [Aspergillus affinis]
MRQLYQDCVTSIVEYASTVWHNPLKDKIHLKSLRIVQRTALIRILSAFKTVSSVALEAESYILPTYLRLKQRAQILAARLSTLPNDHPARAAVERAKIRSKHIGLGHRFSLAETLKTMDLGRFRALQSEGLEDAELRWIPAHIGVKGNEKADKAAKEAAIRGVELSSVRPRDRPIIRLAAAAKRDVRQRLRTEWTKQWERQKVGRPTRRLLPKPDKKNVQLYEHLSKAHTSIIIQMRTIRIGLRHFLYKIKQVDSDRCACDLGSQTPRHVLLECSLHTTGRRIMMDHLNQIEGLRGRIQDYDAVIAHPQAIRYVAEFMQQTGLL